MSPTADTLVLTAEHAATASPDTSSDRRADLEAKQTWVAAFLQEVGCEGLLVVEPENFAWLTSGAAARGVLNPADLPAVYYSPDQRWVLSANVDTQRLFDEELNGLGFQLKEWPWHWGREQLLADLCSPRKVACDRALGNCVPVADKLRRARRTLSRYEKACYQVLGPIVSHALEAACRTMKPDETEREIAGQISHRILHRGAQPMAIEVAADGRSRRYRQCGFTSLPLRNYGVITVTARKYGLCATASRAVSFGELDPTFRKEHDAACKVSATYMASSWPDALPRRIFTTAQHVYRLTGFEHDWRLCPQGHITGRCPVELGLTPQTEELFQADWALVWHASVGAAFSCDTFLLTEQGPELVTPTELWPLKRIKVQGAEFFRPDVLLR
jgi:Xaa-Pro aminopeptidase